MNSIHYRTSRSKYARRGLTAELNRTYKGENGEVRVVLVTCSPGTRRACTHEVHVPAPPAEPVAVTLDRALAFEREGRLQLRKFRRGRLHRVL